MDDLLLDRARGSFDGYVLSGSSRDWVLCNKDLEDYGSILVVWTEGLLAIKVKEEAMTFTGPESTSLPDMVNFIDRSMLAEILKHTSISLRYNSLSRMYEYSADHRALLVALKKWASLMIELG